MFRLLLLVFFPEAKNVCIIVKYWARQYLVFIPDIIFKTQWWLVTSKWKTQSLLFWNDDLHLSEIGYQKFATSLFNFISSCSTSKSTSFDVRKIKKSFPPLRKTNIHISTKENVHHFKNQKFCKPKYIHKSFAHCLHVREVSLPVPIAAICVVRSPLFISANISKPILVSASTVSVISDVTMQSVNVTIVPISRSVWRNQHRAVFYQPSTLLICAVNICKLHVHCQDICNIAWSICISVNCIKIPLNVIHLMYIKLLFRIKLCKHSVLMLLYRM